ncbi:hypothetical protein G7062_10560 [Erysipelothrix sp. HDW6C]|uniref:hypothetical protein n=1 Tax=Erysipelothrix sp. HDW6C TaxID=2714930 RepID=UPI00140CA73D|nr:hypothetical protein [Erysipelothrix sp. HDW6C]QIK70718.1 hypothetical protein G7062_10560 [Erysipelothrix sp. HDW6C]
MINYKHGSRINAKRGWLIIDGKGDEFSIKISHIDAVKFKRNTRKVTKNQSDAEIIFTRGSEMIAKLQFDNMALAKDTYQRVSNIIYGSQRKEVESNE